MARLTEYLKMNGWRMTRRVSRADLILLATCGFTEDAEKESVQFISLALAKKRPGATLAVFGCLAGIEAESLRSLEGVMFLPPMEIARLDKIIGAAVKLRDVQPAHVLEGYVRRASKSFGTLDRFRVKSRLWKTVLRNALLRLRVGEGPELLYTHYDRLFDIIVAEGCMGECTYCAIKVAVGSTRSRPPGVIVSELRRGLEQGYGIFRLNAGDVGCYGCDIGTDIVRLLGDIFACAGDFRLIFADFSPRWLSEHFDGLRDVLSANATRIGYLGFPVQSGSDRILRLMKRGYTATEAEHCFLALKSAMPNLRITSHVLVGFPSETERDFYDSLDFVRRVGFDHVQAYRYSDRPGTPAAAMPGKVPEHVIDKRLLVMRRAFPDTCQLA
jgi:tRNA A37 methylthiotransferase MiaB